MYLTTCFQSLELSTGIKVKFPQGTNSSLILNSYIPMAVSNSEALAKLVVNSVVRLKAEIISGLWKVSKHTSLSMFSLCQGDRWLEIPGNKFMWEIPGLCYL